MSSQVVIPTAPAAGAASTAVGFSYQSIGTTINCGATVQSENSYRPTQRQRFQLSPDPADGKQASSLPGRPGVLAPSIQQFSTNLRLILRDNQTTQFTTAVDKTTGEAIKVDVTLNVLK